MKGHELFISKILAKIRAGKQRELSKKDLAEIDAEVQFLLSFERSFLASYFSRLQQLQNLLEKNGIPFCKEDFLYVFCQVKILYENEQGNYEEILMAFDSFVSLLQNRAVFVGFGKQRRQMEFSFQVSLLEGIQLL